MDYLKSKKESGILLLIDFEKAFDSFEHKIIRKTLQKLTLDHSIYTMVWRKVEYVQKRTI